MPLSALKKKCVGVLKLFSSCKKMRADRPTGSSESKMENNTPSSPPQNGTPVMEEANQEQEEREERPQHVPIGPDIPWYLSRATFADCKVGTSQLLVELRALSSKAFCKDHIASSLKELTEYSIGLFGYIHWLAELAQAQEQTITRLTDLVVQVSIAEDYDRLVKEKSSWTSSMQQRESELNDAKAKLEKVGHERDESRSTIAKDAEILEQQLLELTRTTQELGAAQESLKKLMEEKNDLNEQVKKLKADA
ncbi:unnamed protein product [Calypogeia fissa]